MNKHIIVVGKNEDSNFEKLNYITVYDVKDKSKKRLVYAKLNYEENRLLVETDYLNLIEFDLSKKYFKVELNEITMNVLSNIDDRGIELLDKLLNENDEVKEMNLDINGDLSYITLSKFDTTLEKNYLRARLCENTKVYLNDKEINREELNQLSLDKDDMVRFLLEIDSINIYPQENICGLKNFCLYIDIRKKIDETIFTHTKIENYKFSNKKVNNKIILEDFDLSYLKTDMSPKNDDDDNDYNDNDNYNNLNNEVNNDTNLINIKTEEYNLEKIEEDKNIFISKEIIKKSKNKSKSKSKIN